MDSIQKSENYEVTGFSFSVQQANIKYSDRFDIGLIKCENRCNASGVFTKNTVKAAPVLLSQEYINNKINAVFVNSGNANACTGSQGINNAEFINNSISKLFNISPDNILQCSTGVIGVQLPIEKISNKINLFPDTLSPANITDFSKSIMTTDTYNKIVSYEFETSSGLYKITSIAKGSGMIAPDMATMLSFTITDFPVPKDKLDKIFKDNINLTLNALTVDGDTSTNDTAIILSPDKTVETTEKDYQIFSDALFKTLHDISLMLIDDAEGATKCVSINVSGAASNDDAYKCAKSIAESLLVKTALFGGDPNWGRIACASGYSGAEFNPEKLDISFNDVFMLKEGTPIAENLHKAEEILKMKSFNININLNNGSFSKTYLTSDISYEYVKINAEYTT